MKKTILVILLLAFCVSISGAGITDKLRAVIAAKNAAAPAGGDDTYYAFGLGESGFTSCTASISNDNHVGAAVTVATGGTADKLLVKADGYQGNYGIRICLYNSDKSTLITSGTVTTGDAGVKWHEIVISEVISSGTYYVSWIPQYTTYACIDTGEDGEYIVEGDWGACAAVTVSTTTSTNAGTGVAIHVTH